VEIRKETDENSTTLSEESMEELTKKLQSLELKLEQANILIRERDSKILELNALNQTQQEACNSNLLPLQSDVEQLLLEKMEAEIQCFILTRASSQGWKFLSEDEAAAYEMQKSLPGDDKSLETKLRHSENRAIMLEEMVDKLETQCKDLTEASEVLKLQTRASRTSLFCSIQLVLVCIALRTLLMRFLPSSTDYVPT
jgi:TFIIF-interacting CTD phosphatase-like protein